MGSKESIERSNGYNESLLEDDLSNNSNKINNMDKVSLASRNSIDSPMIQNQLESEGSDEDMESQNQNFD